MIQCRSRIPDDALDQDMSNIKYTSFSKIAGQQAKEFFNEKNQVLA